VGVSAQMDQANVGACAVSTDDDACVACLKSNCCESSLAWMYGASGVTLGECVDDHCGTACPRMTK
jgi:hypothetical protein